MTKPPYVQHTGTVVDAASKFTHVMAVALNPKAAYAEGVIRCITSREGDVGVSGYIDRSQLYIVRADSLEHLSLVEPLDISGADKIIERLAHGGGSKADFLGLEDPDIFIDDAGLIHLYFTMPYRLQDPRKKYLAINLGHAVGKTLDTLEMTEPAITGDIDDLKDSCAKELSVAPVNKKGVRLNLIESYDLENDVGHSTVRIAIAEDMGKPWRFGPTVFHPKEHAIPWIGGHASPGPLLPPEFIDVGPTKRVGIMNGREATRRIGDKKVYGMFSVGLFIYDFEKGSIDWVSPEPLIRDTEARTITFASQFIPTKQGEGILYAHVDDSFVRAYTLYAESIQALLPK